MRWMVRIGVATLVAALVVLMPVGAETPASALGVVQPPVDPYPLLPSQVVKAGGAGVLDGTKSWAQAYAEVQRDVVKAGKPVAPPLTQAEEIVRGVEASSNANILLKGFLGGFAVGSIGVRVYAAMGGNALPEVCGSGLEVVSTVLYSDLMPDCTIRYDAQMINADTTAVPVGWTGAPVITGGAVVSGCTNLSSWTVALGVTSAPAAGAGGAVGFQVGSGAVGTWCPNNPYLNGNGANVRVQRLNAAGVAVSEPINFLLGVAQGGNAWLPNSTTGKSYTAPSFALSPGVRWRLMVAPNTGATAQNTLYWYPEGSPNRPAGQSGDPLRNAKCKVTMRDGTVREGFIGQYRESEGFPMGAVAAACTDALGNSVPQGLLPETIELTSTNTDTGKTDTITTQPVPDFSPTEKIGLTPGDNTGLRLLKVVNGVVQSCMTWEASCVNWWTKTSSGTITTTDEGEYRCEYGGRQVPLSECGVYRHTFDVQTDAPAVTDPVTGAQSDWSATPDPANEFGTGNQSGQSADRCVTSFSWNPVDWVLRPIRCAFEPSPRKLDQVKARLQASWRASGVGALGATLGGFVGAFNSQGGCSGLPFHLEGFGVTLVDTRLLAACTEPAKGIAATVRAVLTVGIIGGGLFATIRYLGSLFGFTGYGKTSAGSNRGVHFE